MMSGGASKGKWTGILALCAVILVVIALAVILSAPPANSGGVGCLFYSAQSGASGYAVYATILNNSTSNVTVERVYFDGVEQGYTTDFPDIGGIWSLDVGCNSTKLLGTATVGTLSVRATGAQPDATHTVRVVTNASSFEFSVVKKESSLALDHYSVYIGPGIDYLHVFVENVGTAAGNVVRVAMDGVTYDYVYNASPPKSGSKWSMAVDSIPTTFIGTGQEGQIYIDTSAICHSCTHEVRVTCSDGSYVEFSFRPWINW